VIRPPLARFFALRWQRGVPMRVLFWRDMIVVGRAVNLCASFVALLLAAQGAPLGLAVAVHLAPLPYNLFLFAALYRLPRRSTLVLLGGGLWLAAATLL
jgi:hypothetical protein